MVILFCLCIINVEKAVKGESLLCEDIELTDNNVQFRSVGHALQIQQLVCHENSLFGLKSLLLSITYYIKSVFIYKFIRYQTSIVFSIRITLLLFIFTKIK
jgi:hypothetical protein